MRPNKALPPFSAATYGAHWVSKPMNAIRLQTIIANWKARP
jgi:hypothetical protein